LTITWDETGGPDIETVSTPGFGSKLLGSALSAFDGRTEVAYLKTGMHCVMQCRIPDGG
ncbi:sensor histidine kinase, partial [Salmonella enterica subsp. enterica serovar Istanbul]|nr:sensor histidine kinase [Salmonella enterica subsp. enterica serovar Istanbul]